MLNFMGYDVTEDSENETSAGDAFVIRRWEPAASDFRYSEMQYKELEQKFELPPLFGLLKLVCGYGAVMMLFGILRLGNPVQGFRREPAYFVVFCICLAGWLGLLLWEKTRPKQVISSPDYQAMAAEARAYLDKGKQALGVPDSAIEVDLLAERYVMQNGVPKHKNIDALNEYLNLSFDAFAQDGCLYLADGAELWEISLSSLRRMHRLKPRFCFADWNKTARHNDKKYKPYKITVNQFGSYFAHCFQVDISDIKGDFYLLIPDYDADAFSALTGLHPDTDK